MDLRDHTQTILESLLPSTSSQVLDDPGSADLSVWVDFGALKQAATEGSGQVTCHGPITQVRVGGVVTGWVGHEHFLLALSQNDLLVLMLVRTGKFSYVARGASEAGSTAQGTDAQPGEVGTGCVGLIQMM